MPVGVGKGSDSPSGIRIVVLRFERKAFTQGTSWPVAVF